MDSIYFISCVSKKATSPSVAADLYTSVWFRKARAWVETEGSPWFILSARHGLVAPDAVISPYDDTLNRMPVAERRIWAQRVVDEVDRMSLRPDRFVIFAGARYREFLVGPLVDRARTVTVPMLGLSIGQQLRWLSSIAPRIR